MTRIAPIVRGKADEATEGLLDQVESTMGKVPNVIATMAHSPAVTQAYLAYNQALSGGSLDAKLREQLALAIAQTNDCNYCVSAHCALGSMAGLSSGEIDKARRADADDEAARALLIFARKLVKSSGKVASEDIAQMRNLGIEEGQIVEVVGHVAVNILTNYLNHVAGTEVDFPEAPDLEASEKEAAACGC